MTKAEKLTDIRFGSDSMTNEFANRFHLDIRLLLIFILTGRQDTVKLAESFDNPGFLLRHKLDNCVYGQSSRRVEPHCLDPPVCDSKHWSFLKKYYLFQ